MPNRPTLTDEERELFNAGEPAWGDSDARAERGAAMLDIWMPGWADRVSLPTLALDDTCQCVLGQIFAPQAYEAEHDGIAVMDLDGVKVLDADDASSGYNIGLHVLHLDDTETSWEDDGMKYYAGIDVFYGFDHGKGVSYYDLQAAWEPLIEARKTADV